MKNLILKSAIVIFISFTASADEGTQNKTWYVKRNIHDNGAFPELYYEVHGGASYSIIKEKLNDANSLKDFIPSFPINWIDEYISVEIISTSNGKLKKAVSANDALSSEQKNILRSSDLATEIEINVKYKYKNAATDAAEIGIINISAVIVTAVPETEAEYIGGYPQLAKYLHVNAISKISESALMHFQQGAVIFTINEFGEIINAKISRTTGDIKTDKLLVEAINKMPRWKPAINSKGVKVKQVFEFTVGNNGC